MKIAHYEQMMDYLTGPRESFRNGNKVTGKFKIDPKASKDKQVLVQEGIYFKPKTGNFVVQLARGDGIKTTKGVNGETMKTLGAAKKTLAAFEEEFPKKIAQIANPPKGSEKFLKSWMAERGVSKWGDLTRNQKSNFNRKVWPSVQKESKLIANKIPGSEMAELLGIDKSVLDNARKTNSIFAKEIEKVLGKPVNLVAKAGGTLGERGEMIYYDKPTSAQIKSLKTYIPKTFGQLTQDVTNRVKTLAGDTEFMSDLKKIKTVDDVDKLKMLQKYTKKYPELNLSSGKLARATLLISQVAGGNAEYRGLDNIKPDKVLSKRLNNMIENAPFGNVYKKEAYDLAMQNIDQQFGKETGTFSKYRGEIKAEFNRLGFKDFKKFNLDEYIGTSIGGFKGAGQYSVFSRLLAQDVNQKSGASYLGRLSQATDKLEDALVLSKGKITKEITEIVKNNMDDALKTSKKTKNSLPYLSLKPPGSKENFGVKRLNQLEAQGLDFKKFYKERGFGFSGLKGAMTQQEIISKLQGLDTGFIEKFPKNKRAEIATRLAVLGCGDQFKADGGRIGFLTGSTPTVQCITRGVDKINKGNIKSGSEQRNFAKLLNVSGNLKNAVKVLGKVGVVGEGVLLGIETLGRTAIYGDNLSESFRKSVDWLVPGNLTQDAQVDKINRVLKDKDLGAIYRKYDTYKDNLNKLKSLQTSKEFSENILDDSPFSYTAVPEGRDAYLKRQEQEIEKLQDIADKSFINPEQQLVATRAFEEGEDAAKATALATRLKKFATDIGKPEDESGLNIDLDFIPKPEKTAPFGSFRDVALTKPEDLLKMYQGALKEGVYGNPGLESSVKKAIEDYAKARSGLENFKKMSLAELVQSGKFSDEEVFGNNPIQALKKINQPVPFKRQSSYYQSPLQLQEQNRLIEEGGMLGAAGGGLLKLAGDRSGKPPEAGPTPQGLDFLIKRGRQS